MDEFYGRTWTPDDIAPEQTDLATSLRVPFLTSTHGYRYVGGVVIGSHWHGQVPDGDEVRLVAAFLSYTRTSLTAWWVDRMAAFAPYDIDNGANSTYLIKYPHGGWAEQKWSWRHGPRPVPQDEPRTLLAVMDRHHNWGGGSNPRWEAWKASQPVFAGEHAR